MNAGTEVLTPCGAASSTDAGAIQGMNINTTAVSRESPHNGIPCVESARTATVASREGVTVCCLCLEEGAMDWKVLEVLATCLRWWFLRGSVQPSESECVHLYIQVLSYL